MDIGKLVARAKGIVLTPKTEWPVAAGEADSTVGLYAGYIMILAALPAIAGFIKGSLIGYGAFGITVRTPIGMGIVGMVIRYVLSLVLVFVIALIIDALAGTFGGQKNQVQALKAAAYSWTAAWIAGIAVIIPWLGWLIALLGSIYSIYLLYVGLPPTMKCPPEKAAGYTALTVVIAIVLSWVIGLIVAGVIGTAALTGGAMSGMAISGADDSTSVSVDKNSTLGKLQAWSNQVEAASKDLDTAQKSGDAKTQQQAMNHMMGAALGSGGSVHAVDPAQLKALLPDDVNGLKRSDISAEHTTAMGMDTSHAEASYRDDAGHSINLDIADTGSAKGLIGFATSMMPEQEHETEHGYDKTYTQNDQLIHEQWDTASKSGEFSITVASRFTVKANGNADSIDQLKAAVAGIDLGKLQSMKDQGTSSN